MTTDFNSLPFTHVVWFMENGDDHWRICALTMDEGDAAAIVRAADPMSGALQSRLITDPAPTDPIHCRHCDNPPLAPYGNCAACLEECGDA